MDESKISDDESPDQGLNQAHKHEQVSLGGTPDLSEQALIEKKTLHIIESFIAEGNKKLSSFLRKKVTFESTSITTCLFEAIEHNYKKSVMLAFRIDSDDSFGLIGFDFILLHTAINLLFGGMTCADEPIVDHLGSAGIRITNKIAEICVLAFETALNDYLNADIKFVNLSTSLYPVFSQKPDKCCSLVFKMSMDSISGNVWMAIPDRIFANIIPNSTIDVINIEENADMNYAFNGQLKDEIIGSTIIIKAVLADIALLVKDVVNLRPGDIIPIDDPMFVFVTHNQKKLFTATAGQLNANRIVKIIDPV